MTVSTDTRLQGYTQTLLCAFSAEASIGHTGQKPMYPRKAGSVSNRDTYMPSDRVMRWLADLVIWKSTGREGIRIELYGDLPLSYTMCY